MEKQGCKATSAILLSVSQLVNSSSLFNFFFGLFIAKRNVRESKVEKISMEVKTAARVHLAELLKNNIRFREHAKFKLN